MALSESEPVSADGQPEESSNREESSTNIALASKLFWYFNPLFPVYQTVKLSNKYTSKVFGAFECIVSALLSVLDKKDALHQDGLKEDDITLDPVLISLFRIWFQAHRNLRQTAHHIETLYEEIVPLIPGQDVPFSGMDIESMHVSTVCCYATLYMVGRLPYHATSFIIYIFKRMKSFLLKPIERIP